MLRTEDIRVEFDGKIALDGVTLNVTEGEVVTVLGPSGSGKSTLLRVIAGLQRPDAGRVLLDGEDITAVPPHRRGIGLVFQDHALFDHRDVQGNVAFGLRMRGDSRNDIEQRAGEPLGSLDRRLRDRLLEDLERLFERISVTALYVTHDQAEAFALGDRVAIMRAGRIVQAGTPDALWARPADEDTARFLGLGNVRDGTIVRPEAVAVTRAANGANGDGVVEKVARRGPTVHVVVRLDTGETLEAAVSGLDHPSPGDRVHVAIDERGIVPLD